MNTEKNGIIGICDHKVHCIIGEREDERINKQDIFIDLEVECDFSPCIETHLVFDTVDYERLTSISTEIAINEKHELLESLAWSILEQVFKEFTVNWARIKIKKPASLPTGRYVFVEMKKTREGR